MALERGEADIAVEFFERALERQPKAAGLLQALARALSFSGETVAAEATLRRAVGLQPGRSDLHAELADALLDLGQPDAALASYLRAQSLNPVSRRLAHMIASLTEANPDVGDYVADLFDSYAHDFDTHLQQRLGYDIPTRMRAALAPFLPPPPVAALDLGCGTGLVADALHDSGVETFDGIDLAGEMLAAARRKGRYRTLAQGDLLALTGVPPFVGPYGLVTAADVFIYMTDLWPVFAAVAGILAPDGLFAFSVEDAGTLPTALRSSGRVAHGDAYVRNCAEAQGLAVISAQSVPVRQEGARAIQGLLYILRRCDQPALSDTPRIG